MLNQHRGEKLWLLLIHYLLDQPLCWVSCLFLNLSPQAGLELAQGSLLIHFTCHQLSVYHNFLCPSPKQQKKSSQFTEVSRYVPPKYSPLPALFVSTLQHHRQTYTPFTLPVWHKIKLSAMQRSRHKAIELFLRAIICSSEFWDNKDVFYPPQCYSNWLMGWVIAVYIFHSFPPELHSHQTGGLLSYGVLDLERIYLEWNSQPP